MRHLKSFEYARGILKQNLHSQHNFTCKFKLRALYSAVTPGGLPSGYEYD